MIYYSKTDKGIVRNQNEDFLYAPEGSDGFFAVVADGMGGHRAGEVASRLVVDTIKKALKNADPQSIIKQDLCAILIEANKNVWDKANSDLMLKGMGSTATVAVFRNSEAIIGHIGDSRAYLYRDANLSQITKDHSYVQMLVDNGFITKKEALRHPNRNVITRAVGTDESVEVDTFTVPLKKGDVILLCSDGLSSTVPDSEIESILKRGIPAAADELVAAALRHGGDDNISVVLAYMDGDSV
jgi:serine/threonine protein phosphatase PrpC